MNFPDWWDWELELTPHIEKRMEDRDFTEVDLRAMLAKASAIRPDVVEGRWVIEAPRDVVATSGGRSSSSPMLRSTSSSRSRRILLGEP